MKGLSTFIFLTLNVLSTCQEEAILKDPEYLDIVVGVKDLQIGEGEDCYLFSNSIIQCNEDKGDPMELALAEQPNGDAKYVLRSKGKALTAGDYQTEMQAVFRTGSGTPLYIRKWDNEFLYEIGFIRTYSSGSTKKCPFYGKGSGEGPVFSCTRDNHYRSKFFIKTTSCVAKKIEVLPAAAIAKVDGDEIVGVVSSASCDSSRQTLQISHTKEVSNEVGIEVAESRETNWEASGSVSVSGGGKVFGVGMEVTVEASYARGGSKGYSTANSKATSTTISNTGGVEIGFDAPGAGMIIGTVKRYKYDDTKTPARMTIECKGHSFQYDTEIDLKSKTYGHIQYRSFTTKFVNGRCTKEIIDCLSQMKLDSFAGLQSAEIQFYECFPPDSVESGKRKVKKKKEHKNKTSSNQEKKKSGSRLIANLAS